VFAVPNSPPPEVAEVVFAVPNNPPPEFAEVVAVAPNSPVPEAAGAEAAFAVPKRFGVAAVVVVFVDWPNNPVPAGLAAAPPKPNEVVAAPLAAGAEVAAVLPNKFPAELAGAFPKVFAGCAAPVFPNSPPVPPAVPNSPPPAAPAVVDVPKSDRCESPDDFGGGLSSQLISKFKSAIFDSTYKLKGDVISTGR
jgi:hypothetical protein